MAERARRRGVSSRWLREFRVPAATCSAPRGCVQPAGASPVKSTGPSTAVTWTAANPLLPVQCTGGYPIGDPGLRGRLPLAHRDRVRDGQGRRWVGRVRDPHLGGLASPRGPVPAGRSLPAGLQQAWGGKMPRITRPQVYRVVREMLPRERLGPEELLRWLEETQDSNERARRSHAKRRAAMRASPHIPP